MLNRALKLLRSYHRFKQIDLAKRLSISNTYLSEIESGAKTPGIDLLEKYSEVFKMPVSSILLFSESIEGRAKPGDRIRIAAADKILRLLEWIDESEAAQQVS